MSRKKKHVAKTGPVWHLSAEEATLARMPRYNAHACGTGAHGDTKYNRAKQKRSWQREMNREGACSRRLLPFCFAVYAHGLSRSETHLAERSGGILRFFAVLHLRQHTSNF